MSETRREKTPIIRNAFILSISFVFVPLLVYWYKFGAIELSNDLEVWSHFSDFFSLWVSLVSLILIFALTYYISKIEGSRYEELRELDNTRNRPILICDKDGASNHTIKNIGVGPALNIKLSIRTVNGKFMTPVTVPPLMAGDSSKVNWMHNFNADSPIKCLVYQDVFNNFTTTLVDDNFNIEMLIGENVLSELEATPHGNKRPLWGVG